MKLNPVVLLACLALPVAAAADIDVVNEEWVVPAHDSRFYSLMLNDRAKVHVTVVGVKNTDKGFSVRVVPAGDPPLCGADRPCRSEPAFEADKVAAFDRTSPLMPGAWTIYVVNSENLLNRSIVHTHVVVIAPESR
jgi:hypothetical protein